MGKDPLIRETLGDHVFDQYLRQKEQEWNSYRTSVSAWERDNYMTIY